MQADDNTEHDDIEKSITVEGETVVNHIIIAPLFYRQKDIKIQMFEKESGLLLMLPDKQDMFTVTPEKYEQPYIVRIENEGKRCNLNILTVFLFCHIPSCCSIEQQ